MCVKGTGLILKELHCSSYLGGRAASKHRAPLKQTGEDRRARLMMGPTQLTYTSTDTHVYADARLRSQTHWSKDEREEFVPGRGVVEINLQSVERIERSISPCL